MTAHQLGQLLLALACVITLARLLGAAARRLGQPPVIGEILAGVLVGPTLFGTALSDHLFPVDIRTALAGLANVGLVLFMFIVGYELDFDAVKGRRKAAVSISVGSVLLPLGLGVLLALWLARHHPVQDVAPFALFIGAAMSVTAFPVLARILTDRGMLRTEVGGLALASGAVDDVVAWTLLAGVVALGAGGGDVPWQTLLAVPYALVMFLVVRPQLRRLVQARTRAGRLTPGILAVMLVGLLLSCWCTEAIGVHAIFGAFVFGAVMPRVGGEQLRHETMERLEQVSVLLLLPVFFVIAGLRVDLSTLDRRGLLDLALILVVAITGKFAGAYLAARLNRIPPRRAGALASLMNTRGLTEIVILTVGVQLGILDDTLFSMMVVMALVTTVMAGPLLSVIYPRSLVERDVAELERAALGAPDAYRVLVVVPAGAAARPMVDLATAVAVRHDPAEVVLSRIVPYPAARVEIGAGLSGDLLAMTAAMQDLADLAEPVRRQGLSVAVFARFSTDPAADILAQAATTCSDVIVVAADQDGLAALRADPGADLATVAAAPPADWDTVLVRALGDDGDAALRIGAGIAATRGASLVVDTGSLPTRQDLAAIRSLGGAVLAGSGAVSSAALVVGTAEAPDAHLVVRAAAVPAMAPA
ncbi:cation:proton antiporter [Dactylosporangium sp. NPDC005555]|uniref:cation:proton antiporter domain-containing protein n=1 Tax=Dactylosporangium sp. NPDC005555 TaxID=3154889 RepID=UPI0033AC3A71